MVPIVIKLLYGEVKHTISIYELFWTRRRPIGRKIYTSSRIIKYYGFRRPLTIYTYFLLIDQVECCVDHNPDVCRTKSSLNLVERNVASRFVMRHYSPAQMLTATHTLSHTLTQILLHAYLLYTPGSPEHTFIKCGIQTLAEVLAYIGVVRERASLHVPSIELRYSHPDRAFASKLKSPRRQHLVVLCVVSHIRTGKPVALKYDAIDTNGISE